MRRMVLAGLRQHAGGRHEEGGGENESDSGTHGYLLFQRRFALFESRRLDVPQSAHPQRTLEQPQPPAAEVGVSFRGTTSQGK